MNLRDELFAWLLALIADRSIPARLRLNGADGIGAEGLTPKVRAGLSPDDIDVILGFGLAQPILGADLPGTLKTNFWLWMFDEAFHGFDRIWNVGLQLRDAIDHQDIEIIADDFGTANMTLIGFGVELFGVESRFKIPERRDMYMIEG